MNILLIGSGGREHAIAMALSNSKSLEKLYTSPGNPGIANLSEIAELNINNHNEVIEFCKKKNVDLVIVGPEQPLANGISDSLNMANIKVFGPSKNAARLESSKGFAKDFMKKYSIPTAKYQVFNKNEKDEVIEYIKSQSKFPIVIKADGLAAGKGVIIAESEEIAIKTVNEMFEGKFGDSGFSIVIEEFLSGEEASILCISDGMNYVTLASSQDHKRIYNNDKGPNTGGMGAYSPAPIVSKKVLKTTKEKILSPVIDNMAKEGNPFVGCLYAGLMIENEEPKVVEFNVRFGDPETESVLSGFRGDFAKLLYSAADNNLDLKSIETIADKFYCSVILASGGYPNSYDKGKIISGIEEAEKSGAIIYQAGTKIENNKLMTSGGRVLAVTNSGESLSEAIKNAYESVKFINFEKMYYRTDIGQKGIKS